MAWQKDGEREGINDAEAYVPGIHTIVLVLQPNGIHKQPLRNSGRRDLLTVVLVPKLSKILQQGVTVLTLLVARRVLARQMVRL